MRTPPAGRDATPGHIVELAPQATELSAESNLEEGVKLQGSVHSVISVLKPLAILESNESAVTTLASHQLPVSSICCGRILSPFVQARGEVDAAPTGESPKSHPQIRARSAADGHPVKHSIVRRLWWEAIGELPCVSQSQDWHRERLSVRHRRAAGLRLQPSHKSVRSCRRETAFAAWTCRSQDKHKRAASARQYTVDLTSAQKSQAVSINRSEFRASPELGCVYRAQFTRL